MKDGWKTSEFWTAASGQVLALLVILGVLNAEGSAVLGDAITKAVLAIGSLAGSVVIAWKYIASRTELKKGGDDNIPFATPISALFLAAGLALWALAGPVSAAQPKADGKVGIAPIEDLSGYYICQGLENGSKKYSGVARISKHGNAYAVNWIMDGSSFAGVAVRQGDTFAAAWAMPFNGNLLRGVNLYKIEPGPKLSGRWASFPGNGTVQAETLTFLKAVEPDDDDE